MRKLFSLVFSAVLLLIIGAPATWAQNNKVWELGTYPGGTWFATWHINDFGVIVGLGDVPPVGADGVGSTHTLAVPLFGPHAGQWIDLGTLGGEQPRGWEEPLSDISNTGLVVSHSTAPDGQVHGVAWTKETGMIDLGTLADAGDAQYASYNSSSAMGTNKLGTLIVGKSWNGAVESGSVPVVWTPSYGWKNGKFVMKWKIRRLDTTAIPGLTGSVAYGVNDFGQIIGTGWNLLDDNFTVLMAALWNPRPDGKGWEPTSLPPSPANPFTQAYGINDRGEIVGVSNSTDTSVWLPLLWKPPNRKGTTYSPPIELPLPKGGFTNCECVGINEPGDLVGDCWSDTEDLPTRWTTKNLALSEIIKFPVNWGFAWGVNNSRIAPVTYGGGAKCPGETYGSCGGAVLLPLK